MPSWWRPYWDYFTSALLSIGAVTNFISWFEVDAMKRTTFRVFSAVIDGLKWLWRKLRALYESTPISNIFSALQYISYRLSQWQVVFAVAALSIGLLTKAWLIQVNAVWIWPLISMADVLCSLNNYALLASVLSLGVRYLVRRGASSKELFDHVFYAIPRMLAALGSYCVLFRHLQRRLFPFPYTGLMEPVSLAAGEYVLWADLSQLTLRLKALNPFSDESIYVRGFELFGAWKLDIPYLDEIPSLASIKPEELARILDTAKRTTDPIEQLQLYANEGGFDNMPALRIPGSGSEVARVSDVMIPPGIIDVTEHLRGANAATQYYFNLHARRDFQTALEEAFRQQGPAADKLLDSLPSTSQIGLAALVVLIGATGGAPIGAAAAVIALLQVGDSELNSTPLGPITPFLNATSRRGEAVGYFLAPP